MRLVYGVSYCGGVLRNNIVPPSVCLSACLSVRAREFKTKVVQ